MLDLLPNLRNVNHSKKVISFVMFFKKVSLNFQQTRQKNCFPLILCQHTLLKKILKNAFILATFRHQKLDPFYTKFRVELNKFIRRVQKTTEIG